MALRKLMVAAGLLMLTNVAVVAAEPRTSPVKLDIAAQPLGDALNEFGRQAGLQVVLFSAVGEGITAPRLMGDFSPQAALDQLLADTSLSYEFINARTVAIRDTKTKSATSVTTLGTAPLRLAQAEPSSAESISAQDSEGSQNTADTQENPQDLQLEEIVVTAQKRIERIRDVPMSISAFTGESLHSSGIDNTKDLTLATPGLVITQDNGVLGIPSIRGVGAYQQGITFDPGTAVYVDGVYSPRFGATLTEFADVKRVEVLKGPQVVLYGRNATAGAVNLISNEPGNKFGGDIKAQFGNYGLVRVNATLDAPLAADKLLFRAAVTSAKDDGFMENVLDPNDRPGRQDLLIGRFALKYLVTEDVSVTLRGYFSDSDGAGNAYKALDPGSLGSAFPLTDPRKVSSDQFTSIPVNNKGANLTLQWNLDWAALTSITAYAESDWGPLNFDADSTELALFSVGIPGSPQLGLVEDSRLTSQETYLVGKVGKTDWLVGASYLHENATWGGGSEIFGSVLFFPAANKTDAYAGYGQLTYALTDKLSITGGARYSYETKDTGRAISDPAPAPLQFQKENWDALTWSGSAKYHINGNSMMYASASTGFKSGGFNQFDLGPALNEEKITSYEVGMKSGWFEDRLRLDVSAYKYKYTDLQISIFTPPSTFSFENAGEAEGEGVEIVMHASPVSGLGIDAGLSLLDAQYTKYDTFLPSDPPVPVSYAGNRLQNAPRITFNLGTSYSFPVADRGAVTLRMDYYHSARRYFESSNDPLLSQEPYDLLNARLGFQSADENWEVALFGKNLTDEVVYANGYSLGTPIYTLDVPRTYGVELAYQF